MMITDTIKAALWEELRFVKRQQWTITAAVVALIGGAYTLAKRIRLNLNGPLLARLPPQQSNLSRHRTWSFPHSCLQCGHDAVSFGGPPRLELMRTSFILAPQDGQSRTAFPSGDGAVRRLTVSTTTGFVRAWLKLCRPKL